MICHALPFEKPFYLKAGFDHLPLHELDGPLRSFYHQQHEQGYQIELLVPSGEGACFQLRSY